MFIGTFRLIFDQEIYFRVRKFYGVVFLRVVFQDFRRSSLSFLPRSAIISDSDHDSITDHFLFKRAKIARGSELS